MMGFWRVSDDKWKNLGQDLLRELSSWVSTASACLALVIKLEEGREGGLADIWVRPFVCISSAATRLHVKATVASGSQPMTHGVFTLHLSGSLPFIEEGFPECEWRLRLMIVCQLWVSGYEPTAACRAKKKTRALKPDSHNAFAFTVYNIHRSDHIT